jgi:hypothetical protein
VSWRSENGKQEQKTRNENGQIEVWRLLAVDPFSISGFPFPVLHPLFRDP